MTAVPAVAVGGKFFRIGADAFHFRAVRLPPAAGRAEAELARALGRLSTAGCTVVSVTGLEVPLVRQAAQLGLRLLVSPPEPWWEQLAEAAPSRRTRLIREFEADVAAFAANCAETPVVLGLVLGRGLSSGTPQSLGEPFVQRVADQLVAAARRGARALPVGWSGRYPGSVWCPITADFFLLDGAVGSLEELRLALYQGHRCLADRPVLLGDIEVADGRADHEFLREFVDVALGAGVAGLELPAASGAVRTALASHSSTRRPPPDDLAPLAEINRRTVRDLPIDWPEVSVVVCAYNAASTLEECLSHCDQIDYPRLEVIVVDDGSTDDTAAIARRHWARLVSIEHAGLSTARNAGYRSASGDLIAYLDADAFPPREWVWYLALGALGSDVVGVGGPNVPPAVDPVDAHVVALSPGGPAPQLRAEDRAWHIPGCNMCFWKEVLESLGGFDPTFLAASDDVDFCERVQQHGGQIGYHPAALVWHHRRAGLRPYFRQQRGYGRSYVAYRRRFPDRRSSAGRWANLTAALRGKREQSTQGWPIRYQSLYWGQRPLVELLHRWVVPPLSVVAMTTPLGLLRRRLALPAAASTACCAALFVYDMAVLGRRNRLPDNSARTRALIATARMAQPVAFQWGKLQETVAPKVRVTAVPAPAAPAPTFSVDAAVPVGGASQ